jgi:hypothetical protein
MQWNAVHQKKEENFCPKTEKKLRKGILSAEARVNTWSLEVSSQVWNSIYFHREPETHTELENPLRMTGESISKRILQYNQEEINTEEDWKILKA